MIRQLLGKVPNVEVLSASNGRDGIELALKHKPKIVLIDVEMPEVDGYGVLSVLRSREELKHSRLIALTVRSSNEDFKKGFGAGFNGYITKPIDAPSFLKKINTLLADDFFIREENVGKRKHKILYIEDNDSIFEFFNEVLSEFADVELIGATEGRAGIDLALQHKPKLVLVDIRLPNGMDGFQVLKVLRSEPVFKNTKVIAITAHGMKHHIQEGLDAGFDDYIVKPFDMQTFLGKVRNILDRE